MSGEYYEPFPWLLEKNFSGEKLENFKCQSALQGAETVGVGQAGKDRILRYDVKEIENHIKQWIKSKVRLRFHGIKDLEHAAKQGNLRSGQLIFEEVHLSPNEAGIYSKGSFDGIINPLLTKLTLKSSSQQQLTHFHVAVYVGVSEGNHLVVDNNDEDGLTGRIGLVPLRDAFFKPSTFFIVSPPKDDNGETMRYMIQQRALATVGIRYKYCNLRVSWEQFGLLMMGLFEESKTIQREAVAACKKNSALKSKTDSFGKLKTLELHEAVLGALESVRRGVVITLEYLVLREKAKMEIPKKKNDKGASTGASDYIKSLTRDYNELMNAAATCDQKNIVQLMNQGIDLNSITAFGKTALTIAATRGSEEFCKALISETKRGNKKLDVNMKDGNGLRAIDYAALYGHTIVYDLLSRSSLGTPLKRSKYIPPDIIEKQMDGFSRKKCNFADLIKEEQHFLLGGLPELRNFYYYEVTFSVCEGYKNRYSYFQLEIGFCRKKENDATDFFYRLQLIWKNLEKRKKLTIGFGIDTISNIIAFTKDGDAIDRPFYIKSHPLLVNTYPIQPTVHVQPKCDVDKDLELPGLKVSINSGPESFMWTSDKRILFGALNRKGKLFEPPFLAKSQTLKTIEF